MLGFSCSKHREQVLLAWWVAWSAPVRRGIFERVRRRNLLGRSTPARRGKRWEPVRRVAHERSTPAHWGNTTRSRASSRRFTVHPRTPGEYVVNKTFEFVTIGPPPHTRGKTPGPGTLPAPPSVHPRTPGENVTQDVTFIPNNGPPPHTGGKLRHGVRRDPSRRSTPAHRGKTMTWSCPITTSTVHPRTPGENRQQADVGHAFNGPPPRTGGKHLGGAAPRRQARSTPAHRGKTRRTICRPSSIRPRSTPAHRGKTDRLASGQALCSPGPPPRTGGKPLLARRNP